jgi:DNA modification methylase
MIAPTFTLHQGDVMTVLPALPSESVQCVVTSPPYWGLRDYGLPPSVWNNVRDCAHRWGDQERGRRGDVLPSEESTATRLGPRPEQTGQNDGGRFCVDCGAWRGCLGLEPTPALFIEHMVEIFRHVRRVLHHSGTLWLNLGDCYITSPHGAGHSFDPKYVGRNRREGYTANRLCGKDCGLRNKDLVMMPARVALALQADGWILRSQIPWIKSNGMPESATDRPGSAVEYIFLFSKSTDYFYDREAVAMPQADHERTRRLREQRNGLHPTYTLRRDNPAHGQNPPSLNGCAKSASARHDLAEKGTRGRRNSDWFLESFKGLFADPSGQPLAILANPQPFSMQFCAHCGAIYETRAFRKLAKDHLDQRLCVCGASKWLSHFATFPERMVSPCIQAGTSEIGTCALCGNPYERVVTRPNLGDWNRNPSHKQRPELSRPVSRKTAAPEQPAASWLPTCADPLSPADPVPCKVLDPFAGSARTGLAALRLGRSFEGIELNPNYIRMAAQLLAQVGSTEDVRQK